MEQGLEQCMESIESTGSIEQKIIPGYCARIRLYDQVENAPQIVNELKAQNEAYQYAFIDAASVGAL